MDVYFCKKSLRTSLCPLRYDLIITARYNANTKRYGLAETNTSSSVHYPVLAREAVDRDDAAA